MQGSNDTRYGEGGGVSACVNQRTPFPGQSAAPTTLPRCLLWPSTTRAKQTNKTEMVTNNAVVLRLAQSPIF